MIKRFFKKMDTYVSKKEQVFIVPTRRGFKYIFINFTIFLIALSYANNMALLIAFLMVSYFVINMLETHKFIQDFEWETGSVSDFFLSHPMPLTIKTKSPLAPRAGQVLQAQLMGKEDIYSVKGTQSSDLNHQFTLMLYQRGLYQFQHIKIFTTGYTGLFYVWRYFPFEQIFHVYPPKRFIDAKHFSTSDKQQNSFSEAEFQYHIPYTHGLSSKRIDWKVYARVDSLYWKKFQDHEHQSFEINYHQLPGESEEKLEYMSFLIDKYYREGSSWKLILPSKVFPEALGHKHYKDSLESLSVF